MSGILMSTLGTFLTAGGISVNTIAQTSIKTAGTGNLNSGNIFLTENRVYVVLLAWDPSGNSVPTATVADGVGNTYTSIGSAHQAPATTSSGGGVRMQAFATSTTSSTFLGTTITATFSASITAKCMIVIEIIEGTQTERNTSTTSRGTSSNPSYTSPSGDVKDLIISVMAQETNTAGIPTGGSSNTVGTWSSIFTASTTGGGAASNIMLAYQYAVIKTSGTQTISYTRGSNNNWATQTYVLQAA